MTDASSVLLNLAEGINAQMSLYWVRTLKAYKSKTPRTIKTEERSNTWALAAGFDLNGVVDDDCSILSFLTEAASGFQAVYS